ncbi:MAG: UDP-2,3-diacylglucosamine diphosphatase [Cellvibrionaceae bacterium]|nr:UDP-2,3-diacylglucosamine diphosphatase [Cellvibrionaceae bacterium]
MTTLFISDLHLDQSRPIVTAAFERFMEIMAPNCDALYILGDFFEVWIGDDDDCPFNARIVKLLQQFTNSGGLLYFMVGNRDFLIGDDFASRSGATLLEDPTVIDLNGTPTLLMHGDSLCTDDTDYMSFRLQARSPLWQEQLLSQPLAARREIARQLREQSQSMNSLKADDIMDVNHSEVARVMSEANVSRLIHGHTHRPEVHRLEGEKERMVLGDWHDNLWWIQASANGDLTLNKRSINDDLSNLNATR